MGHRSCPSSDRRRRRVLRLPAQPRLASGPGAVRDRPGRDAALPRDPVGGRHAAGLERGAGPRFPARRPRVLRGIPLRGGVPSRRRVPVLLAPHAREFRRGRTGRRFVHLRRGRRRAPARGSLDVRASAPARAALRRRLREGRAHGLGRDHVLRRHALHDPPGLALRVPPAGLVGSQRKPDQDRLGRRQRLHVGRDLDGGHRHGDGRDRPRLARVGRRRSRRQDGGHELPRAHDGVDGQGKRRTGGPREGLGRGQDAHVLAESGPAGRAAAGPSGGQPDLRPEDRATRSSSSGRRSRTPRGTGSRSRARASSCPTRRRSTWTTASRRAPG